MGDRTKIEWVRNEDGSPGATWNPVTGCTKISAGCDHCYAETLAERFRGTPGHYYEQGFDVVLRPDKLDQPLRWRKPRHIFVNSMSDLFHASIPDEYIAKVFAVMAATPRHTFQVLTKRHARMRSLMRDTGFADAVWAHVDVLVADRGDFLLTDEEMQAAYALAAREQGRVHNPSPLPLPNVWLGVSVEDQQWADIRIPALLQTPAAVRFISAEPLLGPVDLTRVAWSRGGGTHLDVVNGLHGVPDVWQASAKRLDWVIVGGESGAGARPMHPEWARSLRDQCVDAGVPFMFKQWGDWAPGTHPQHLTAVVAAADGEHLSLDEFADLAATDEQNRRRWAYVHRVGNRKVGRALDGVVFDGMPTPNA